MEHRDAPEERVKRKERSKAQSGSKGRKSRALGGREQRQQKGPETTGLIDYNLRLVVDNGLPADGPLY